MRGRGMKSTWYRTLHDITQGRVDIAAAINDISHTGKEITAAKTGISHSTKVTSCPRPRLPNPQPTPPIEYKASSNKTPSFLRVGLSVTECGFCFPAPHPLPKLPPLLRPETRTAS
eukprot:scaffold21221_cov60-Phaeocystis_antarctica.AAC.4